MGRQPAEKALDFGPSVRRLLRRLRPERVGLAQLFGGLDVYARMPDAFGQRLQRAPQVD